MFSRKRFVKIGRLLILILIGFPSLWVVMKLVKTPNSLTWVPSYTKDLISGQYGHVDETRHMFVLVCDHWEPGSGQKSFTAAQEWLTKFKQIADLHHDTEKRNFRYTWFYPIDNFDHDILALLSEAANEGYGEVEVHWHHHHSSSSEFERDLKMALAEFMKAGAITDQSDSGPHFAFIHGNWTLDNSGSPHTCGISDEISILMRNGCYADLTFPALGNKAQPHMINRIYYAIDTPAPKSYDRGIPAKVGSLGVGLMMIPGPLALDFRDPLRLFENAALDDAEGSGLLARIRKPENYRDYFKSHRVRLWNQIQVGIEGRPDWVFVKLHAHGMQHRKVLLGGELDAALSAIESYCESHGIALHYIVAREAYNLVRAAEQGAIGAPEDLYDFAIKPPLNTLAGDPAQQAALEAPQMQY